MHLAPNKRALRNSEQVVLSCPAACKTKGSSILFEREVDLSGGFPKSSICTQQLLLGQPALDNIGAMFGFPFLQHFVIATLGLNHFT